MKVMPSGVGPTGGVTVSVWHIINRVEHREGEVCFRNSQKQTYLILFLFLPLSSFFLLPFLPSSPHQRSSYLVVYSTVQLEMSDGCSFLHRMRPVV